MKINYTKTIQFCYKQRDTRLVSHWFYWSRWSESNRRPADYEYFRYQLLKCNLLILNAAFVTSAVSTGQNKLYFKQIHPQKSPPEMGAQ